jgi:cobalt-zinc-cadmium efflux system protein
MSTETALTVHLLVPSGYPGDAFVADVCSALKEKFGIGHTTIQIETDPEAPCALETARTVGTCIMSKTETPVALISVAPRDTA